MFWAGDAMKRSSLPLHCGAVTGAAASPVGRPAPRDHHERDDAEQRFCAISHVAVNGANPPKIVTDTLKLNDTPTARVSTGNCSDSTDGKTPL